MENSIQYILITGMPLDYFDYFLKKSVDALPLRFCVELEINPKIKRLFSLTPHLHFGMISIRIILKSADIFGYCTQTRC